MALEPRMGETGAPFDLHSIEQCSAALASAAQPHATLALIHRLGATLPGHCLFSVNAFRAQTMEVERLYSSNPQAYPVGGRKQKKATAWGQQVLLDRQLFVGEGDAALRAAFADHELMHSLGVHSIINVPVVWRDTCLGVLNFACPMTHIEAPQIAAARWFGLIAVPAFACCG